MRPLPGYQIRRQRDLLQFSVRTEPGSLSRCFVDPDFDGFDRWADEKESSDASRQDQRRIAIADLCYVCMTQYDAAMPNVEVAFPPQTIKNTLGEYLSSLGLTQLRIAETEKYAHVTFFFNGGVEKPNPLEDRILIPSPKVATYDLKPEMSAYEVTDAVIKEIESLKYDCIILNFANADMVGHTGNFDAAVKAVEAVDKCSRKDSLFYAGGGRPDTDDCRSRECRCDDRRIRQSRDLSFH